MNSSIVIVSWYSNCLGLRCVHELKRLLPDRNFYVIQTGKPVWQRRQFRTFLPSRVHSLPYPSTWDAQHGAVLNHIVRNALQHTDGLWFIDHDVYSIEKRLPQWFDKMEHSFERSQVCLAIPHPKNNYESLTIPFFWIAPCRLPQQTPSLVSIPPFKDEAAHRIFHNRPWDKVLLDKSGKLGEPEKDTVWAAFEYLQSYRLVKTFPKRKVWWLPKTMNIPEHIHLGGIWALGGLWEIVQSETSEELKTFVRMKARQFLSFLNECPQEWKKTENPVLIDRAQKIVEENP